MLSYTPVEYNFLETLAKTLIIPAKQNQFLGEKISTKTPVRPISITMNTTSAFTGYHSQNQFWCRQFKFRQIRILTGGQPTVDFDCRLYVTGMKPMNFQDELPSIPIDDFKAHDVVVFDLASPQDASENCHYPELVREPQRLELNFNFPLELVLVLIVLGEQMSLAAVDKLGVVGKNI